MSKYVLAIACLAIFQSLPSSAITIASDADLVLAGGACSNCDATIGECSAAETCTADGNGKYDKKTPTNISPASCKPAAKKQAGKTECTLSEKKECFIYKTCTAADCKSGCSDKTLTDDEKKANDKPTKCNTGGYTCTGT